MNVFDMINEIAVLGTAFLMLACSTVWYSSALFGKSMWTKDEVSHESFKIVLTFAGYVVALTALSYMIAAASISAVSSITVSLLIALFAGALLVPLALWEGKRFSYIAINFGFLLLFIIGGTVILEYWPW